LRVEERSQPTRKSDEVLIRIRRVGICGTDMHIFQGTQPYLSYPRVMGHELAGEVVEGPQGSALAAGDIVYIMPYMSCGHCVACKQGKTNCCTNIQVLGVHCDGGLAEFIAVPEQFVFKTEGITVDQAAMIEFLAIGAHAVRRCGDTAGKNVLVVGAGPIGLATALFSRLNGGLVTLLDARDDRLEFARTQLGFEQTVRVGPDDMERLSGITNGDFFDIVFDATGNRNAMERGFSLLAHGGTYVFVSIVRGDITFNDPEFHKRETTLLGSRNATVEDFEVVVDAMKAGDIPTGLLNTHRAKLTDLPDVMPAWIDPQARVIKALVEC
jgi:2-desacetyl-2-hydroxyethyl bacteriochlorophyllide A dehydrogenase